MPILRKASLEDKTQGNYWSYRRGKPNQYNARLAHCSILGVSNPRGGYQIGDNHLINLLWWTTSLHLGYWLPHVRTSILRSCMSASSWQSMLPGGSTRNHVRSYPKGLRLLPLHCKGSRRTLSLQRNRGHAELSSLVHRPFFQSWSASTLLRVVVFSPPGLSREDNSVLTPMVLALGIWSGWQNQLQIPIKYVLS